MNSKRFVYFKAAIYMLLAGVSPLAVAAKGWIDTPPKNSYEIFYVALTVAGAMILVLKGFVSDSSIKPEDVAPKPDVEPAKQPESAGTV